jgi:hypothetical protein
MDIRFELAHQRLEEIATESPDIRRSMRNQLQNLLNNLHSRTSAAPATLFQEREIIRDRTTNFDMENSRPWRYLTNRGWNGISLDELIGLAKLMAHHTRVPIDREAKRRKPVLVKWMEDNWDALLPVADRLSIDFIAV